MAAITRTSTRRGFASPTGRTSSSWSTRSSFAWSGRRQLADLVEEERAAVGLREEAAAGAVGAGEGALGVAEELALEQRLRDRGAVHRHEGLVAARRLRVDRAREHLLAGAALAREQHRGLVLRRALDELEHLRSSPGEAATIGPLAHRALHVALQQLRWRGAAARAPGPCASASSTSEGWKGFAR